MKIIIESDIDDFKRAMKPFYNGCAFKGVFPKNGDWGITFGCYFLVNLARGFEAELRNEILNKGIKWGDKNEEGYNKLLLMKDCSFKLNFNLNELKIEIMKIPPCRWCGGSLFMTAMPPPTKARS